MDARTFAGDTITVMADPGSAPRADGQTSRRYNPASHATENMQIRQLTAIDAAPYHELRLRMLREHADAFTSSFEEDSRKPLSWIEKRIGPGKDSPHDFVLGAFDESDSLVGIVGLAVETRIKQRHKGVLFGMYVAAEASANGVGRALLSHCLDRARAIPGLEQINLTVTATNERARKFYETAGFRAFGVEERALKIGDAYYPKAHMVMYLVRSDEPEGA
jgi:RimJ/RimL family protein N-acetyltransferase